MSLTNLTWFLFTYEVVCLMCFVKESVLCFLAHSLGREGPVDQACILFIPLHLLYILCT